LDKEAGGWLKGEVVSFKKAMEDIENIGHAGEKAAVIVCTFEEAYAIRETAKHLKLMLKIKLIIDEEDKTETPEWLKEVKEAQKRHTIFDKLGAKEVWHLAVHDEVGQPETRVIQNVKEAEDTEVPEVVVLRVEAYERLTEASTFKKWKKKPEDIIEVRKDEEFQSYTWDLKPDDKTGKEFIVGYIKVKKEQAGKFERTDISGVFVERLKGQDAERCQHWVDRLTEESDKAYQIRAREEAKKADKPIVHRRGGGNCFGIKGLPSNRGDKGSSLICRNVPEHWGPNTLEQWLQGKGFSEIRGISAPRSWKQGWLFMGKGLQENEVQIHPVGKWTITIKQHKQKPRWGGNEGEPIGRKSAWTTEKIVIAVPDDEEEKEAEKEGEDSSSSEEEQKKPLPMQRWTNRRRIEECLGP
jgi:hypothetical protein